MRSLNAKPRLWRNVIMNHDELPFPNPKDDQEDEEQRTKRLHIRRPTGGGEADDPRSFMVAVRLSSNPAS